MIQRRPKVEIAVAIQSVVEYLSSAVVGVGVGVAVVAERRVRRQVEDGQRAAVVWAARLGRFVDRTCAVAGFRRHSADRSYAVAVAARVADSDTRVTVVLGAELDGRTVEVRESASHTMVAHAVQGLAWRRTVEIDIRVLADRRSMGTAAAESTAVREPVRLEILTVGGIARHRTVGSTDRADAVDRRNLACRRDDSRNSAVGSSGTV